ncbi:hypothetical protein DM01DRAFT_1156192 [Hesseltinella vesiculosa]|uniref:Uncharacterized protein n=1 Tax=Hesseltinella vesiculosa TaxID=101127 RepID=A0A1X2GS08_9FUNG|nr:hypothetical protein DM01DRAFT_1156192 [Hesseltinella vesiculosa]
MGSTSTAVQASPALPSPATPEHPTRSYHEAVLAACKLTSNSELEQANALWMMDSMKMQPISILNANNVEEVALLHSDTLEGLFSDDALPAIRMARVPPSQKRKRTTSDGPDEPATEDTTDRLLSVLHSGPYRQLLSIRQFVELDQVPEASRMLNDSWLFLPQLRFACAQLLTGSIIMSNKTSHAVLVNYVEIDGCGQTSSMNGAPSPSSVPPARTKYPNVWLTVHPGLERSKLMIRTNTLNALATSSIRIDTPAPAGTLDHFDMPWSSDLTCSIFLDIESVHMANKIAVTAQLIEKMYKPKKHTTTSVKFSPS